MARILFLTQYYPPEIGAAAIRISETATRLARRGHEVTVLTTLPNYPSGTVPPGYRHGQRRRELRAGVRIVRVWSYISPNRGFLRRVLSQLSFGCLAPFLAGKAIGQPDLIIFGSAPLFTVIAGRVLARRTRRPFVLTVSDLWPESAVQLGALRNRLLIWLAERLEWSTYRRAAAIWCVTAGIRETLVRRGVPERRTFLLTNGVDTETFKPMAQTRARADLGWEERWTLLYAGTLGLAHGLDTVLEAAELLREHSDIRIVFAGEGAAKARLVGDAKRRGLTNVTFLPSQPHDRMPTLLAAADACLVSLRRVPLFEGALPSKMYEALACGRPLILGVDGEARRLIEEEAGAAVYSEPENAEALANAVLRLKEQPELARLLGERGRAYVTTHFDRDALVSKLEGRLTAILGAEGGLPGERASAPISSTAKQ